MNFFKALARMFTLPRALRKQIDANPIVQQIKPGLSALIAQSAADTINANVKDPLANALIQAETAQLLSHSGLNK